MQNKDKTKDFTEVYDEYADALYRHCFFRVFSKHRAEEIVQETFLKTWEYMQDGKEIENIRALLYRVLHNLIVDDFRKHKEESLDAIIEEAPWKEPVAPNESYEDSMAMKDVIRAIHTLRADDRDVLLMRYVDDLTPQEISKVLGVSSNVVSVRIHRATEALKKIVPHEQ